MIGEIKSGLISFVSVGPVIQDTSIPTINTDNTPTENAMANEMNENDFFEPTGRQYSLGLIHINDMR